MNYPPTPEAMGWASSPFIRSLDNVNNSSYLYGMIIGICFECGNEGGIDNHHVVPESLGGTKTVPLCYECHGLVHDRDFVKHRALVRAGIERARAEGKYNGRKVGSGETVAQYLEKDKTKKIIDYLDKDLSIRTIANTLNYSTTTVVKTKKFYKLALTDEQKEMSVTEFLSKLTIGEFEKESKPTKLSLMGKITSYFN